MRPRSRSLVSRRTRSRSRSRSKNKRGEKKSRSTSPRRFFARKGSKDELDKESMPPVSDSSSFVTPPPAKPQWKSAVDPNTGRLYYYHRATRVSTWTKPKELASRMEEPNKVRSFPSLSCSRNQVAAAAAAVERSSSLDGTEHATRRTNKADFKSRTSSLDDNDAKNRTPTRVNRRVASPSNTTETTRASTTDITSCATSGIVSGEPNSLAEESSLNYEPSMSLTTRDPSLLTRDQTATSLIAVGSLATLPRGNKTPERRTQTSSSSRRQLPTQAPEEILEGQEVLLVQEDTTDREQDCRDSRHDQEEIPDEQELEEAILDDEEILADLTLAEKKKKRKVFSRKSNTGNKSSSTIKESNERITNFLEAITSNSQDAVPTPTPTKKKKMSLKKCLGPKKPTQSATSRVVLLPSEHSIQEAAWNEEQARQLLFRALAASNIERRRQLCQNAIEHAHDALRLRDAAQDEMIGLLVGGTSNSSNNSRHRSETSMSGITVPTVMDQSYYSGVTMTTYDGTLFSGASYVTGRTLVEQKDALDAIDDMCLALFGSNDEPYVESRNEEGYY